MGKSRLFRYLGIKNSTPIEDVVLQEGETIDAKWVTAEEILQLMEADKFVPIGENQYHKELLGVDTNF